jgi:hypothetical protein
MATYSDTQGLKIMSYPCASQLNASTTALLLLSLPWHAPAAAQNTDAGKGGNSRDASAWYRDKDPHDAEECRQNMHRIHDAIVAFERAHKRLPHWLSELTPDYLDGNSLVCPYVKKIGDLQSWRYGLRHDVFDDPGLTSYSYEFCEKELPLWTGVKTTWADYKRRQMEVVGDGVPIARCFAHNPILNLAYNGRIYSNLSNTDWESLYEPKYKHEDLQPEPLFFHKPPRADVNRYPRREADADPRLLDLTANYNAYLDDTWLPYPRNCELKELPRGVHEFGGSRFDVRGLIQLNGSHLLAPYPIIVQGIKIGRPCGKIQFLHGTRTIYHPNRQAYEIKDGTKVAAYIVNYRSGSQIEIPIVYGRDVKDWWYDPDSPEHNPATVAWDKGENLASRVANRRIRLFQTTWENPWKDQPVDSLSLASAMAETAPFVVAITLE